MLIMKRSLKGRSLAWKRKICIHHWLEYFIWALIRYSQWTCNDSLWLVCLNKVSRNQRCSCVMQSLNRKCQIRTPKTKQSTSGWVGTQFVILVRKYMCARCLCKLNFYVKVTCYFSFYYGNKKKNMNRKKW